MCFGFSSSKTPVALEFATHAFIKLKQFLFIPKATTLIKSMGCKEMENVGSF